MPLRASVINAKCLTPNAEAPWAFRIPHLALTNMKECPLCGETMRLSVREIQDRVPGVSQPSVRVAREWICPECDYFEDAEGGEE